MAHILLPVTCCLLRSLEASPECYNTDRDPLIRRVREEGKKMDEVIQIDGTTGEGGGQVLRTSTGLAALLQIPQPSGDQVTPWSSERTSRMVLACSRGSSMGSSPR